jgi:hypothetical protein
VEGEEAKVAAAPLDKPESTAMRFLL